MIIKPKIRTFMCITAHPAGCEANVREQIEYIKAQPKVVDGPKKVLIIGASTGYGLAARITAAYGCGAATVGVFYERAGEPDRCASAGWYNSAAFHKFAEADGLYAKSVNGDAFTDELKVKTIDLIKQDLGQVDLVLYSVAAPRRKHPKTGVVYNAILKPIGQTLNLEGIDTDRVVLKDYVLEPATQQEIDDTVAVMGGEDWQMWIDALDEAGVLAPGVKTASFTYLGEKVTQGIYWHGTIGAAKQDLDKKVLGIRKQLEAKGGDARVAVLKAVVTQASSAIPVMPLYLSTLFMVMKERGTHEGCIEQIYQLYNDNLYSKTPTLDSEGRYRTDLKELLPDVQAEVTKNQEIVTNETLHSMTDFPAYRHEFMRLFGFDMPGIDYDADISPVVPIPGIVT